MKTTNAFPPLPFYIGISGNSHLRCVEKTQGIEYKYINGELVDLAGGSAIFLSTKEIRIAINTFCQKKAALSMEKVEYGGEICHMLIVLDRTQYDCSKYVQVISLDTDEWLQKKAIKKNATDVVASFIANTTNNDRPNYIELAEIFPKQWVEPHKQPTTPVVGYFPMQQLDNAVNCGEEQNAEKWGWILHGCYNVWAGDCEPTLGTIVLDMARFCGCGSLRYTFPPVLQEVISGYTRENGLFEYSRLEQLHEKYGHVTVDVVLGILDKLELIEHGGSVPGWLSDLGQFIVKKFPVGIYED